MSKLSMSKNSKILALLNFRLRITIQDGRMFVGQMIAFDKHMNLVISECEEFRKVRPKGKATTAAGTTTAQAERPPEREEKRSLGLVILRGECIVSISVEAPPPTADERLRGAGLGGGPGIGRPAGRGLPVNPMGMPGLAGPVRGVGGPPPGMMAPGARPLAAAAPVSYGRMPAPGAPPMPGAPPPGFPGLGTSAAGNSTDVRGRTQTIERTDRSDGLAAYRGDSLDGPLRSAPSPEELVDAAKAAVAGAESLRRGNGIGGTAADSAYSSLSTRTSSAYHGMSGTTSTTYGHSDDPRTPSNALRILSRFGTGPDPAETRAGGKMDHTSLANEDPYSKGPTSKIDRQSPQSSTPVTSKLENWRRAREIGGMVGAKADSPSVGDTSVGQFGATSHRQPEHNVDHDRSKSSPHTFFAARDRGALESGVHDGTSGEPPVTTRKPESPTGVESSPGYAALRSRPILPRPAPMVFGQPSAEMSGVRADSLNATHEGQNGAGKPVTSAAALVARLRKSETDSVSEKQGLETPIGMKSPESTTGLPMGLQDESPLGERGRLRSRFLPHDSNPPKGPTLAGVRQHSTARPTAPPDPSALMVPGGAYRTARSRNFQLPEHSMVFGGPGSGQGEGGQPSRRPSHVGPSGPYYYGGASPGPEASYMLVDAHGRPMDWGHQSAILQEDPANRSRRPSNAGLPDRPSRSRRLSNVGSTNDLRGVSPGPLQGRTSTMSMRSTSSVRLGDPTGVHKRKNLGGVVPSGNIRGNSETRGLLGTAWNKVAGWMPVKTPSRVLLVSLLFLLTLLLLEFLVVGIALRYYSTKNQGGLSDLLNDMDFKRGSGDTGEVGTLPIPSVPEPRLVQAILEELPIKWPTEMVHWLKLKVAERFERAVEGEEADVPY
ncbi:hypothetical protein HDU93_000533 [Gonapodya sp. JEL0774]|nr:hypothetical protein HDU93_000533 [Gonapodya sp. JEL0774]